MPLSFTQTVASAEVARQLSNDPAEVLEVLTELADIFDMDGDAEAFALAVAENVTAASAGVSAFLHHLADRIDDAMGGVAT